MSPQSRGPRFSCGLAVVLSAALIAGLAAAGCQSKEKRPRSARQPTKLVVRDVPQPLRDTIGAQVTFERTDTVLVSGIGIVVGLNGTGGGPYPDQLVATMEQELSRRGVSRTSNAFHGTAFEGMTPRQVLESKSVAIVTVQAAIPPGLPKRERFDVLVRKIDQSGTTSLEGGTLWATDLRPGPPTYFGGVKARLIAEASGSIFVNPFAANGDTAGLTTGRVLNGGLVVNPLEIYMVLDNPSPERAKSMVHAINSRFQRDRDGQPIARGRSEGVVALRVPPDFGDRPGEFLRVVQGLTRDYRFPDEYAKRFSEDLKREPWLAEQLSYCLEAVGEPAKKFLYPLYDDQEVAVRMAALRAGASLGDTRAFPPLLETARAGPPGVRARAIELIGGIDAGPRVDEALRGFLGAPELDVRVAAMEALTRRAERVEARRLLQGLANQPGMSFAHAKELAEREAQFRLAGNTIQGIEREGVGPRDPEDKTPALLIDRVRVGEPLIYITQSGHPRIVLFGENLRMNRPLLVSMWEGRLMLISESETDDIRVWYREPSRVVPGYGEVLGRATTGRVGDDLADFIRYLAHKPSETDQRPGLGLTYSQIVGVLAELRDQGATDAGFATERDRLLAQLLKAGQSGRVPDRPETDGAPAHEVGPDPGAPRPVPEAAPDGPTREPMVVPLKQREEKKSGKGISP